MMRTSMVVLLATLWSSAARAEEPSDATVSQDEGAEDAARPFINPRKKRKKDRKEARAVESEATPEQADTEGDEKDGPPDEVWDMPAAETPPQEGIWAWVERLEGEMPTDEQVEALEEMTEVEQAEQAVDPAAGGDTPVVEADPLFLDQVDPSEFDIPIVVNDAVRHWVEYFANGAGRKHYARWLTRSTTYRPMMYAEIEKRGMPRDLVYLSMIESGYNAHAYSKAHAAGLWQFIPGTGKLYDLRIDYWVDERRDPALSTVAALSFLDELHRMFDDWHLAFAAYNTGPGRVRRVARETGMHDYWKLRAAGRLHPETAGYVPKIIAAAIIGHHPERYGFKDIKYKDELKYDTVHVDGSVEVAVLARTAGMSTESFQHLNPSLRRWASPPEGYEARVPVGTGGAFSEKLAKIPKNKRIQVAHHTVQRGETLSAIASKYRVSTSSLASANRIRNHNRIYVGMKLTIPGASGAPAPVASGRSSGASTHRVAAGDTLSGIGAKYGVTTAQIKGWNGLKADTIQVGQVLKVKAPAARTASGGSAPATTTTYTVRSGDTLGKIATKHGVTTAQLQAWNGIRNPSHITVGQKLKIKGGTAASNSNSWKTHTVQNGDSLGKIATRYGCSVKDLQTWNGLDSTVIHPGQRLKIKS